MLGFELGGGALAGLIVVTVAIVIVAWLILRIVGKDHLIRIARIGVFVERQRVGDTELAPPPPPKSLPPATHHLDPEDRATKITWPERDVDSDP